MQDVMEMEVSRINWWIDWLEDRRTKESRKIRQAINDSKGGK